MTNKKAAFLNTIIYNHGNTLDEDEDEDTTLSDDQYLDPIIDNIGQDDEDINDELDPDQDIRQQNTLSSDSEWSCSSTDFNFHQWDNITPSIKNMMNEILTFTTSAQLSESNLQNILKLIDSCTKLAKESPQEDFSKLLTLNGFYSHYSLNNKTKKVHYCKTCKDFQQNEEHIRCSCDKEWIKDSYLFWRPLRYALQERIAFEPTFIAENFNHKGRDMSSDTNICDRQGGLIFKKIHQPWIDESEGKRITGTLNGDGVSPFKKSMNNFYNFFIQFNEMNAPNRKKSINNFLWAVLPHKADKVDIEIGLKIIMNDLNYFNSQCDLGLEIRIERVIADLPARSEMLFFKRQGFYFCHLCTIKGTDTSGSHKVYPLQLKRVSLMVNSKKKMIETFKQFEYRDYDKDIIAINNYPTSSLPPGMDDISPLLKQDFNPTPAIMGSYDNMHFNYEGMLVKFLNLIDEKYWKEFDQLYLKQRFPSFFHRHPRSIVKNINHLKSIEVYILCHYYLDLFQEIPSYYEINEIIQHIQEYINILDKLMSSFQEEELDDLDKRLKSVLFPEKL